MTNKEQKKATLFLRGKKALKGLKRSEVKEILKTYLDIKLPLTKLEKDYAKENLRGHKKVYIKFTGMNYQNYGPALRLVEITLAGFGPLYLKSVDTRSYGNTYTMVLSHKPTVLESSYNTPVITPSDYQLEEGEYLATVTANQYNNGNYYRSYYPFMSISEENSNGYYYWLASGGTDFDIVIDTPYVVESIRILPGVPSRCTVSANMKLYYDSEDDTVFDGVAWTDANVTKAEGNGEGTKEVIIEIDNKPKAITS